METMKEGSEHQAKPFEIWKFYGEAAGADKNWMINIVTWLFAFSSATTILRAGEVSKFTAVILAVLGILFSALAALTALLYGGYATRNWAKADRVAHDHGIPEQYENYDPFRGAKTHWASVFPLWLAQPCRNRVAPVFWLYFLISVVSFCVHIARLLHIVSTGQYN